MKTYAIIPSGGTGSRTGLNVPKQYVKVNDKELIAYTLEKFQECEYIDEIIIPAQPEFFELLENIKSKYNITKLNKIVEGGAERQDSVLNALSSIKFSSENDLVAVHDAARPLISIEILSKAIKKAKVDRSVIVAQKAKDTLLKGNNTVEEHLDRSEIFYVQTPQIFDHKILLKSIKLAKKSKISGTDESTVVKLAGYNISIVEGSSLNFKITTKEDLEIFEKLIKNP